MKYRIALSSYDLYIPILSVEYTINPIRKRSHDVRLCVGKGELYSR
jgi:hypothetical protein